MNCYTSDFVARTRLELQLGAAKRRERIAACCCGALLALLVIAAEAWLGWMTR
jgi:hypothetical protein